MHGKSTICFSKALFKDEAVEPNKCFKANYHEIECFNSFVLNEGHESSRSLKTLKNKVWSSSAPHPVKVKISYDRFKTKGILRTTASESEFFCFK